MDPPVLDVLFKSEMAGNTVNSSTSCDLTGELTLSEGSTSCPELTGPLTPLHNKASLLSAVPDTLL